LMKGVSLLNYESYQRKEIERKRKVKKNCDTIFKDNLPSTKVGVLATGDDVQEWSGVFDELARNYDRKTIALDMEAHAIGAISAFNNIPFIIAKGVGDFAKNGKKFDNRYIEYACKMSCNFIISFFESLDEVELI